VVVGSMMIKVLVTTKLVLLVMPMVMAIVMAVSMSIV